VRAVSETLAEVGCAHTIAPLLVRNFEYYTGPVFHFYLDGTRSAVAAVTTLSSAS
jgi:histidyl-tRNA synthetase